jgi:hypothetical protein
VLVQFVCGSRNYIHKTPDINSEFKRRKKNRDKCCPVLFCCIDVNLQIKRKGKKIEKEKEKKRKNLPQMKTFLSPHLNKDIRCQGGAEII